MIRYVAMSGFWLAPNARDNGQGSRMRLAPTHFWVSTGARVAHREPRIVLPPKKVAPCG